MDATYQKIHAKIRQAKMSFRGQGKKEASKKDLHEEGSNQIGMEVKGKENKYPNLSSQRA